MDTENKEVKEPIERLEELASAVDQVREQHVKRYGDMSGMTRKNRFPQEQQRFSGKPREYGMEELSLGRLVLNGRGESLPNDMERSWQEHARRMYTMTTQDAGAGAELVPDDQWPNIWQDVHAASKVAALFQPFVNMTAKKIYLAEEGDAVFYKPSAEGVAVTATDLATAKRTLEAWTLRAQVDISDELDAGAVVSMLATIRAMLIRKSAEVIDSSVLNADTSTGTQNINYYAASGGSNIDTASQHLIGFDGLIHYCLNEVTGQVVDISTLEVADFGTLLAKLDKYAVDTSRLAFIMDVWTFVKAVQLSDFQTVDKLGDKATLLTGQLGAIYGIPVIVTDQCLKSNATGQVDQTAGNNVKGRIVLVHRDMWKVGSWIPVQVRSERSESKGSTAIVCNLRIGLVTYGDRSSSQYSHTCLGYDATV